jgi:ArsR family transcriptional regulator, virulence genes transcriptional regulator
MVNEKIQALTKKSDEQLAILADLLKAIAHPVRLKILCMLCRGEKNVGELENALHKDQAIVSQQLKILKLNGLVKVERKCGYSIYSISPERKDTLKTIMRSLCEI